jgi:hypothetical protein
MARVIARLPSRIFAALALLASAAGWAQPGRAQPVQPELPLSQQPLTPAALLPESQEGFYDVEELERLFRIAREAGFTEDEIRNIRIEDEEGRTVNAWDYLQEIKRRRAVKDKAEAERLHRLYITVQDIIADLQRRERDDLKKLREQTIFPE